MEKKIDFLALYQRLFQTLSHGKMQELMDVSYEITGVPILAVDIAYNLLGAVPKNKTGDYYWDYLVEHKRYDMDMTVQLYTDGIMQSVNEKEAPYIVDWGAATEEFPKILGVIKINNIGEVGEEGGRRDARRRDDPDECADHGGTDEGDEHYPGSVQSYVKGENFGKQHGIGLS